MLTLTFYISDTASPANNGANVAPSPTITKDTVAPATPTIGIVATDDVINSTERTATVTVTGGKEVGSTVTLNGNSTTDSGATWSRVLSASEINSFGQGTTTLTAIATDTAGNVNAVNGTRDVFVDTIAPAITVSGISISDDTGLSSSDFLTMTAAQTIAATLSETPAIGDVVYGSVNGGSSYTDITSKTSGTAITWTGATLTPGNNVIIFKVIDWAGNSDVMSTTQNYGLDIAAPGASSPISTAQRLKAGAVSTSNVQSMEDGNIYLIKTGTSATTLAKITSAISANSGFLGRGSASAATPYIITVAAGLLEGVYDIVSVDVAGNVSTPVAGWLTVDNTAPVISSVSIPNTPMKIGNVVTATITVTSDTGAGAPYTLTSGTIDGFTLENFSRDSDTSYHAHFTITDTASRDVAAGSDVMVNNLVLTDTAGNPSTAFSLAVSPAGDADAIDAKSPTVSNVSIGAGTGLGGVIKNGDTPTVTVVLSESVDPLTFTKADVAVANGTIGDLTTADNITFTGTFTPNIIEAGTNLVTVGVDFKDTVGNDASGTGATSSNYYIDTVLPTVTNVTASTVDGSYKAGETVAVTVTFSEAVNVNGFPRVELAASTTPRYANYVSGSGSATLTFNYIIQTGDTAADLDYSAAGSLTLNSGTIKDLIGNDATLTLVNPGDAGSLGANKAIVIDTTAPTVAITYNPNTPLKRYDYVTITATLSDTNTIDETPVPQIAITTQGNTGDLAATNMSKTSNTVWTYRWMVPANTKDGIATVSIIATDLAGNYAVESNDEITINDTASPIVSAFTAGSITSSGATLSLNTDELAMCRYSNTEKDYASMTAMTVSTSTSHSQVITGLTASTKYDYYVRCSDTGSNIMQYSAHVAFTTSAAAQGNGTLGVTGVTASSSYATVGGGFTAGWSWIFNVTVPTSEASTTMKFADWVGVGTSTIPALNNIRFYSPQSSNASTTASAKLISGANTYADYMTIDGDLDVNTAGRQIQIIVETQIPTGSAAGAYSTSYGVKSI